MLHRCKNGICLLLAFCFLLSSVACASLNFAGGSAENPFVTLLNEKGENIDGTLTYSREVFDGNVVTLEYEDELVLYKDTITNHDGSYSVSSYYLPDQNTANNQLLFSVKSGTFCSSGVIEYSDTGFSVVPNSVTYGTENLLTSAFELSLNALRLFCEQEGINFGNRLPVE